MNLVACRLTDGWRGGRPEERHAATGDLCTRDTDVHRTEEQQEVEGEMEIYCANCLLFITALQRILQKVFFSFVSIIYVTLVILAFKWEGRQWWVSGNV